MKKELIIVGASDFGKEIGAWLPGVLGVDHFEFKGFLDDNIACSDFGAIKGFLPQEKHVFVCAINHPKSREGVIHQLRQKGAIFINLIHSSAVICSDLLPDNALIVAPYVFISRNVKLGVGVVLNIASSIGHDAVLDDFVTTCPHGVVSGFSKLGKRVFMGSHACVIPHKTVGDDAIIGAGSAVMRNVPPATTVVGVPAKRLI